MRRYQRRGATHFVRIEKEEDAFCHLFVPFGTFDVVEELAYSGDDCWLRVDEMVVLCPQLEDSDYPKVKAK